MTIAAMMPGGRLMKKIDRQPIVLTSSAPSAGPASELVPQMALKSPWILARSSRVKMSASNVRTVGMIPPAPIPCRPR